MEHRLQTSKAQRHQGEDEIKKLKDQSALKDADNNKSIHKISQLEEDVSKLKIELGNTAREKGELVEKNQKMAKENLPVLEQIDVELAKLAEATDQLTADAEMLSSMFRLAVEENRRTLQERGEKAKELSKVRDKLRKERDICTYKQEELQKKETLYQRCVEARRLTHESYIDQKKKIKEVDVKMQEREAEWEAMMDVLKGRDQQIELLGEELRAAHKEIDELEQQKKHAMQELQRHRGQPYSALLEQIKAQPQESGSQGRGAI